jgi:hypothetical protein
MKTTLGLHALAALLFLPAVLLWRTPAGGVPPLPGGFVEKSTSTAARPRPSRAQIESFVPSGRGKFKFPPPYNTEGIRITVPSDCGGANCLFPVGYSYWSNINNHVGSDRMLIFLGLDRKRGGTGPTLFSVHKPTDEVTNLGPLFPPSSPFASESGEGWYFSATQPTKLYVSNEGPQLQRYDVLAKNFSAVFDVTTRLGKDKTVTQTHSSADDRVHSGTLQCAKAGCSDGVNTAKKKDEAMGCLVYDESTRRFSYYPRKLEYDECQIDKSGRYLLIKDNVSSSSEGDNRIIDLSTNNETVVTTKAGALGHSDNGFGYSVGALMQTTDPGMVTAWKHGQTPLKGTRVYRTMTWAANGGIGHVAHSNAKAGVAPDKQYACGSNASRAAESRLNEIVCFRLDGSMDVLVVAPVMTDLNAPGGDGGGCGDYCKAPKGNIDVTGRYFIWTSNMSGNRLEAFIVKIPAQLLGANFP